MLKVLVKFEISHYEYILLDFTSKSEEDIRKDLSLFIGVGIRYAGKENVRKMAKYFITLGKTTNICSNTVEVRNYDFYYCLCWDYETEIYRFNEVQ